MLAAGAVLAPTALTVQAADAATRTVIPVAAPTAADTAANTSWNTRHKVGL